MIEPHYPEIKASDIPVAGSPVPQVAAVALAAAALAGYHDAGFGDHSVAAVHQDAEEHRGYTPSTTPP